MSIYDKDLLSGRNKVETAISRIKTYCTGKKTLVAFSGGKDSQCCYHLAKMAGVDFHAQYSITRFEPPELIRFIRETYPDVTFRRAYKMSLVEQIKHIGLPNRWFRWCCDSKHIKTEGYDIAVIGIRWAESARRRARWNMFGFKQDKTAYVCPIVDWTDADVWEFLNSNKIPHCSLYDEGYHRIGCVCCPLAPDKMSADAKRWPKTAAMLLIGHRKNMQFNKDRGKDYPYLKYTAEDSFDYWLKYGSLLMNKDVIGASDDVPCLFAGTGFSEGDGMMVSSMTKER